MAKLMARELEDGIIPIYTGFVLTGIPEIDDLPESQREWQRSMDDFAIESLAQDLRTVLDVGTRVLDTDLADVFVKTPFHVPGFAEYAISDEHSQEVVGQLFARLEMQQEGTVEPGAMEATRVSAEDLQPNQARLAMQLRGEQTQPRYMVFGVVETEGPGAHALIKKALRLEVVSRRLPGQMHVSGSRRGLI